jgi:hypothetical protein
VRGLQGAFAENRLEDGVRQRGDDMRVADVSTLPAESLSSSNTRQ